MTFYEAALRVLEASGRPMNVQEITEQSIAQNLLSHVGKTPDQTMLSRLAAMARRTRDRRVIVTAKDTFALVDWALPENLEALEQTGLPPVNEEESMPPLRAAERHPDPRADNVRSGGRGAERKRQRGDEEDLSGVRQRRFPPLAETIFEVLSNADQALRVDEVMQRLRNQALAPGDLSPEQLLRSLVEDNQRRLDAGRRAQFFLSAEKETLALEPFDGSGGSASADVQRPFADKLGLSIEAGRVVFARPAAGADEVADSFAAVRAAAKDARKAVARALRRRLMELDPRTLERAVVKCLKALGFHEIRVLKRSREGAFLSARRRDGSAELRYGVRLLKAQTPVDRRAVQDLRREGSRHGAQLALLASPADLRGEARSEAQSNASPPVILWCGEALADRFLDGKTAVWTTPIELFEINDRFFVTAQTEAEEAQRRREDRTRERHRPEPAAADEAISGQNGEPIPPPESPTEEPALAALSESAPGPDEVTGGGPTAQLDESDAEEESDLEEGEEMPSGAAEPESTVRQGSEKRRRRRRRRGRRGKGRPPAAAAPTSPDAAAPALAVEAAPPVPDEKPNPEPSGGGDEK